MTIAGWSKDTEATGGQIVEFGFLWLESSGFSVGAGHNSRYYVSGGLRASDDGAIMGDNIYGPTLVCAAFNDIITAIKLYHMGSYTAGGGPSLVPWYEYVEESTGAAISHTAPGSPIGAGGIPAYIDIDGFARTAGAKLITRNGATDGALRKQTAIVSAGSSLGIDVSYSGVHPCVFPNSFTKNSANWSIRVYCNKNGLLAEANGSNISLVTNVDASGNRTYGANYVEAGTGNAVTYSGNWLVCNGQRCKLTNTSAIVTNTGAKVVLAADPTHSFLRVWS